MGGLGIELNIPPVFVVVKNVVDDGDVSDGDQGKMDADGGVGDDSDNAYWVELGVLEELEGMGLPGGHTQNGHATCRLCSRRESL